MRKMFRPIRPRPINPMRVGMFTTSLPTRLRTAARDRAGVPRTPYHVPCHAGGGLLRARKGPKEAWRPLSTLLPAPTPQRLRFVVIVVDLPPQEKHMITQKSLAEENLSLIERRAYMQLPLEERRTRLAAQADAMIEHYGQEPEQRERLAWQGGDIVE